MATGCGWCSRCCLYSDGRGKTYAATVVHLAARTKGTASVTSPRPTCPSCPSHRVDPTGWCEGCECYVSKPAAAVCYRCVDCKDTGKVTLFTSTGPCRACGGKSCSS